METRLEERYLLKEELDESVKSMEKSFAEKREMDSMKRDI